MDISEFLPQLGISAIFVVIAIMLYKDMRADSLRREQQILQDSKAREDKLMEHLDKVSDTLEKIDSRIQHMDTRIEKLEERAITRQIGG